MATLTDTLNTGSLAKPNLQAGAPTNLTQAITGLAAAKTGKDFALPTSSPAASNIQEQVANQETRQQAEQVRQAGALERRAVDQQVAQIKQAEQAELVNLDEQRMSQQADYQQRLSTLLEDFEKQGDQLDLAKRKAQAEQAGFLMRMSSDKYLSQLETQARKDKLNSEVNFRDALARAIFRDEIDLFQNDLDFRTYLNSKKREATELLSTISLDQALDLANTQAKSAGAVQFWQGIGSAGSAAAEGYDKGLFKGPTSGPESASIDPTSSSRRSVNSPDSFDLDELEYELTDAEKRQEKRWDSAKR